EDRSRGRLPGSQRDTATIRGFSRSFRESTSTPSAEGSRLARQIGQEFLVILAVIDHGKVIVVSHVVDRIAEDARRLLNGVLAEAGSEGHAKQLDGARGVLLARLGILL